MFSLFSQNLQTDFTCILCPNEIFAISRFMRTIRADLLPAEKIKK
ncbi:hypothetical protein HMPREF1039_0460 [Megasphaera lornae]|uniref:Uncharacterized protein n=1 Tax=Megasphaera lornae TaxID=1000568 RepID=A0ABN0D0Q3_9FIRM|nr:hypothetical protein HMPREF1039_0460 [Megasphaera lornae]